MNCRTCGNQSIVKFLSLGTAPLANNFLSKEELSVPEKKFPLELCFCDKCKLVQLGYVVPPELMFTNYVYVTSTTKTFQVHFTKMAETLTQMFSLGPSSVAVDIGSNDGLLLKGFQKAGVKTIGVEPAANVASIAENDGVETINDYFNERSVMEIISRKGHADIVTANNVFAHINDIDSVVCNVKKLLKDAGVFVIEVQYIVDTIEKMTFDNIYHEHLSYFSLTPLMHFFGKHGMHVFRADRVDSHGGSLRVFVQKETGTHPVDRSVESNLSYEHKLRIEHFDTYKAFAEKVYAAKRTLVKYVNEIKSSGKSLVAYGAPAKGNTLLNFCQIGHESISYVVEDNPLKQGLFTPGTHIPVVSSRMLDEKTPDCILILAWNFADEILKKTRHYADKGVKFIIPLPVPRIV